jgi:serine-type D-Ala-D-Ala carboxypeptidase/endopeptidase
MKCAAACAKASLDCNCRFGSLLFSMENRLTISLVPAIPSQEVTRRMLAGRVGDYQLSLGMVVGTTEAKSHLATSYGRCDVASGRRVDEASVFEIGSVTKLFTALLLAETANHGEVQLGEPVVDLLPTGTRVPSRNGREITLRDLASHHSGFPRRPTNLIPNDPVDPYAHYTRRASLRVSSYL